MLIDRELLTVYGIAEQDIEDFSELYPDGGMFFEIVTNPQLPDSFLWTLDSVLPLSDAEREELCSRFEITETDLDKVFKSKGVKRSLYVVQSQGVVDSSSVSYSDHVVDSQYIRHSKNIDNCCILDKCQDMDSCNYCIKTTDSADSVSVDSGKVIKRSDNVLDSAFVSDSRFVIDSSFVEDSLFVTDVYNVKNCMFCYGIESKEYMIFNQPVSKSVFNTVKKEVEAWLKWEQTSFIRLKQDGSGLFPKRLPPLELYTMITSNFWRKIEMLPNFNPEVLYAITHLKQFILDY